MTRFARAIGSNSSNQKVPNDATPWSELKPSYSGQMKPIQNQLKQVEKIRWKTKANKNDSFQFRLLINGSKTDTRNKRVESSYSVSMRDDKGKPIVRFEGFSVRKEDAIRLKELKKKLLTSKLPHQEIKKAMQLERRRAEKFLSRKRKQVCFHCRQSGHILSQCPNLNDDANLVIESGICFKCGSTEHQHSQCHVVRGDNYKFASCFICKQEGHISKQCPDNPRGLYPEGGSCRICGDVTHMKKDCPRFGKKKKDFEITLSTLDSTKLEILEGIPETDGVMTNLAPAEKKKKIIRM